MLPLSQCIAGGIEEAMQMYINSDDYQIPHKTVNAKIAAFRSSLSTAQQTEFNQLINEIDTVNAEFIDQAYVTGVVNGIALRESISKQ